MQTTAAGERYAAFLSSICKKAGTIESEVIAILNQLDRDKIIEFEHQKHDASITFLVPREDESSIYPFVKYIKTHAKNKTNKIEALLTYVENNEICRTKQLLAYFGETNTKNCGICSICKPADSIFRKETIKRIYLEIMGLLKTGAKSSREIVAALPYPEAGILKVLQLLMEKEIILLTPTNTYKLKQL